MRRGIVLAIVGLGALGIPPARAQGPVRATARVRAVVEVGERTALHVSTRALAFVVPPGATDATATLDFSAAVRTAPDREVLLVGCAGAPERIVLRFRVEDASGHLLPAEPTVLSRWRGGGRRQGQIVFTLEHASPGVYIVPIDLTVSVP